MSSFLIWEEAEAETTAASCCCGVGTGSMVESGWAFSTTGLAFEAAAGGAGWPSGSWLLFFLGPPPPPPLGDRDRLLRLKRLPKPLPGDRLRRRGDLERRRSRLPDLDLPRRPITSSIRLAASFRFLISSAFFSTKHTAITNKSLFLSIKSKNSVPSFPTKLRYFHKTQLKNRKTQFFRNFNDVDVGTRSKNRPDQCCFFNENIHFLGWNREFS